VHKIYLSKTLISSKDLKVCIQSFSMTDEYIIKIPGFHKETGSIIDFYEGRTVREWVDIYNRSDVIPIRIKGGHACINCPMYGKSVPTSGNCYVLGKSVDSIDGTPVFVSGLKTKDMKERSPFETNCDHFVDTILDDDGYTYKIYCSHDSDIKNDAKETGKNKD
jgi:hypothetical protein